MQFIKVSGGTGGAGSAPPAFQRAEQARTAEELEKQRLLKVLAADDAGLDKNAESYAEELAKRAVIHRKVRRKRKGLAEAFRETVASRRMEREMEEALGSLDVATIEGGLQHAGRLNDGSGATTSQGETANGSESPSGSRGGTPSPRGDPPVANGHAQERRSPLGSQTPGGVASPSVRLEGLKGRPTPISPLRPANAARTEAAETQPGSNGTPGEKASEPGENTEDDVDGRVSDEEQPEGEVVNEPEQEEEDRLSDIDDDEVDGYLHTEEEVKMKSIIWEELHKEYLADQESKRAAVEAAEMAHVAAITAAKDNAVGAEQLEAAEQVSGVLSCCVARDVI